MPHSQTAEALVLRAYNVGEADRFFVLFTKELGRVSARANAVRKLTSRMGGTLLPFHHVTVQLKQSSAGYMVTSAMLRDDMETMSDMSSFTQSAEAAELLLLILQDEEPVIDIYSATLHFLQVCGASPFAILAYKFHLIRLLGVLPERDEMEHVASLSEEEHAFIDESVRGNYLAHPPEKSISTLRTLAGRLLSVFIPGMLKAPGVGVALS